MTVLYGISNCDTVKKARRWLDNHGVSYTFHDFRKQGLDNRRLQAWDKQIGWETLLNRRGTTWRQLPEAKRQDLDTRRALALLLKHPTLIKRPVLEHNKQVQVGFTEADYQTLFGDN